MASGSDLNDEPATYALGQILAGILTAQNSCPVHEACDSSCPRRIGVHQYRLMPDGEKRGRVDQRAQLAAVRPNPGVPARTQPLVIREGVPRFVHEPLTSPGSMIRLLRIKPGLFRADPVDCELLHFHMNQAPAYGALSYCWGPPPDNIKLLCNGNVFYGRASMERALKRLRAGFKPGQREEYIWADAICINQQDLTEKDAQVRFMEQIYSKATTVYVDLGETQGQSVSLGGLTLQFSSIDGMGTQDLLTESDRQGNPLHYKTAFQALTHPWFTRTWIIQEAALARNLKYMSNGTVFTQQYLDSMLNKDAMRANPDRQRELMSSNACMQGYLNYQKLQRIKGECRNMDSLELIQLTRDFKATNPSDKIFGLFALLGDAEREAIGPYTQSTAEAYTRFAALQVRSGRLIKLLDSAGLQRRPLWGSSSSEGLNVPSWVPDWTAQSKSPKGISTLRPVPYAASGTLPAHIQLAGNGLSVRGLPIDVISTVVHVHSAPRTAATGEPDILVFHDRFRACFDELVRAGESPYLDDDEAFARVLLADDMYTGANALLYSSPITDPAATYRDALAAWREGKGSSQARFGGARLDAAQTFQMQASAAVVGRGFATTRVGAIGLVPPCAQVGDMIVVVLGARVPYVMRRASSGAYVLVGDAFLHGFMYGEVLAKKQEPVDLVLV